MNSTNANVQLPSIKSLLNSIDSQQHTERSDTSLNLLASASNAIQNKNNGIAITASTTTTGTTTTTTTPMLQPKNSLLHLNVPKVQTENSISKLIHPSNTETTATTTSSTPITNIAKESNYTIKQETNKSQNQITAIIETNTISAKISEEIRRKSEPLDKRSIDRRQSRSNLPKETIQVLNSWLLNHLNNPYPTAQEKRELLIKTGLTKIQLSNWFINVRRRKIFSDYYNIAKRQNDDTTSSIHNDYVKGDGDAPSTEVPLTRRKKLIDRLRELKKLTNEE